MRLTLCGLAMLMCAGSASAQVNIDSFGHMGIGIAPSSVYFIQVGGASDHDGIYLSTTLNPFSGTGATGFHVEPTINFAAWNSHLSSLKVRPPQSGTGVAVAPSVANILIQDHPLIPGVPGYSLKVLNGGTVMLNADTFEFARNRGDNLGIASQFVSVGSDSLIDYDKSRAGNLIGAYFAPSLKLLSGAATHTSVQVHGNVLADGPQSLTTHTSLKVDAASASLDVAVGTAKGVVIESPTIGAANVALETTGPAPAIFGGPVNAAVFSVGASVGVSVSGSACVITAIEGGIITGASCTP